MRTQPEDSSVFHQDSDLKIRANVQENDEESILNYSTSSCYGPCCPSGCQYCRPNCHEQSDGQDYF